MQKEFIGSALVHGSLIVAALLWMGLPMPDDAPAEGSVVVDIISSSLVTSNLSEVIASDANEDMVLGGSEVSIVSTDNAPVIEPLAPETLAALTEMLEPMPTSEMVEPFPTEPVEVLDAIEAQTTPSETVETPEHPEIMTIAALDGDSIEVANVAPLLMPGEGSETLDIVGAVMPTPRPADLEAIRAAAVPPPPARETPRPAPQQAGNGGNSNQNSAAAQSLGGQAGAGSGGNADIARYPGQVERRVARLLRYPNGANGARGEVQINFTLDASGGLIKLAIGRSSGNDVLDQAALVSVQRAAPFPAFPAGTSRNHWDFSIPLAFSR
ncbi:energy transducer TonB [Devosia sp. YIM 151766]|uniref:energy transducer TonB family protein n=1 Tax=Devosia sp. YIM 151766 TaxID=3017325 RepID=UPI00255C8219|nr:energy transducer TonB [Devosia sp. YIM 151766]WIY52922.1 energy transducer TonB [Devosia sp. YIM 151766]